VNTAPEKGVFPLDHAGECKDAMKRVLACLQENGRTHMACRDLSKSYLECRMAHNLMQSEDLSKLGFGGGGQAPEAKVEPVEPSRGKEKEGFVAGTFIKQRRGEKNWF
jgi:cytochrome c oxidase assembly protein subunit 19